MVISSRKTYKEINKPTGKVGDQKDKDDDEDLKKKEEDEKKKKKVSMKWIEKDNKLFSSYQFKEHI